MIEVVAAGPLTTVQDAHGRPGWRHLGVPAGGAADRWSARLANRLVGNPDGAALLEITLGGVHLRFGKPILVALTGGMTALLDGLPATAGAGFRVRAGASLRIDPGSDARSYLAVGGGIAAQLILGSRGTDLRSGFGGHHGRALRDGDRLELEVGGAPGGPKRWVGSAASGPVRVVAGPHAPDARLDGEWTVAAEADRVGVRLDGRRIEGRGEVPSMGLPVGAIQVPPDGRPIVLLADGPVTGGYPVPACVIRADLGRVARLRPGDRVMLVSVSLEEARREWQRAEKELAMLEPVGGDEAVGWAGAHE